MKHTPGPWGTDPEIKHSGDEIYICSMTEKDGDWPVIAKMTREELFIRDPVEIKANARLIAAAPELLKELKLALGYFESRLAGGSKVQMQIDRINKAIAKAEGES